MSKESEQKMADTGRRTAIEFLTAYEPADGPAMSKEEAERFLSGSLWPTTAEEALALPVMDRRPALPGPNDPPRPPGPPIPGNGVFWATDENGCQWKIVYDWTNKRMGRIRA